ncbi:PREDICTED: uncharacterized protein LOC109329188 [Lupinus angustifolius]|uniref:uncharacterized protein LOC109329188 n=1 Tax=Lupinus angustifolius TaxID=3871 RepID=UPI00092EB9B2|nr:PREDICTED: uncharacterized protein LOC109329188 [Lupinus angustifolius]
MSVLINGSPAAHFSVSKGLRQGDPMAPFLFLMVAEGFAGFGFEGELQQEFSFWFKVVRFDYLGGGKLLSLQDWLPTVLLFGHSCRGKSEEDFYLQCMCDVVSKRLASWKDKHISFGGRLILLNSVLANIPTYMLSLYKTPKKVLAKLVSMQRNFLWGNKRGGKGIAWVAWDVVCKPKVLGGLGVKDLLCFNNALLGKWRWRRLQNMEAFWVKVINSKYGSDSFLQRNDLASRWWKDLQKVGSTNDITGGWFDENIWKEIGTGLQTLFWHDTWVGNQSLKMVFPRLFRLAINQQAWVGDNGLWRDDAWHWNIQWRRSLFGREESMAQNLYDLIHHFSCKRDTLDIWRWGLDNSDSFKLHEALRGGRCVKVWRMLWFAVVWSVWLMRNEAIFLDKTPSYVHLFDLIHNI